MLFKKQFAEYEVWYNYFLEKAPNICVDTRRRMKKDVLQTLIQWGEGKGGREKDNSAPPWIFHIFHWQSQDTETQ